MLFHQIHSFFLISVFNGLYNLQVLPGAGFLISCTQFPGIIFIKKENIGMGTPKGMTAVLLQIFVPADLCDPQVKRFVDTDIGKF